MVIVYWNLHHSSVIVRKRISEGVERSPGPRHFWDKKSSTDIASAK